MWVFVVLLCQLSLLWDLMWFFVSKDEINSRPHCTEYRKKDQRTRKDHPDSASDIIGLCSFHSVAYDRFILILPKIKASSSELYTQRSRNDRLGLGGIRTVMLSSVPSPYS